MAIGSEVRVELPGEIPVHMAPFSLDDAARHFRPIDSPEMEPVSRDVTEAFRADARTWEPGNENFGRYQRELEADESSWWRGVWVDDPASGERRLIGYEGCYDIEPNETGGLTAHTRIVLMDPEFHGRHIGRSVILGRLVHSMELGVNHWMANIALGNNRSFITAKSVGSVCEEDKIVSKKDPRRHQMRLWHSTPERPIDWGSLSEPLHGDTWEASNVQLQAALALRRFVHVIRR